ncbi:hypothetical protein BOX37_24830 [Nocardia mangyaensis]|uniref:Uncharacterized protein n=1 Tax=Nocardia mangyaensis TaxID=2213200 RepID=A0A1J0VX79_9NOCA|nr:hypothetical protein [Nocardia mangyaensis]APE36613.1 hypothetical protein BOX37_24830 [Nocardia mangyaensis]
MDEGRAKIIGPAVAAGAVSLGLIVIGACGVGQQEVYVPPPPLSADLAVAPSRLPEEPTATTYRIEIPPSPTWRVAPYMPPRKPFSLSSTETTPKPPAEDDDSTESRPPEAAAEPRTPETTDDSTTDPEPEPEPAAAEPPTTTSPARTTTRPGPTRTVTPPRIGPPVEEVDEFEATEDPSYPPTHAYDRLSTTAQPTATTPTADRPSTVQTPTTTAPTATEPTR